MWKSNWKQCKHLNIVGRCCHHPGCVGHQDLCAGQYQSRTLASSLIALESWEAQNAQRFGKLEMCIPWYPLSRHMRRIPISVTKWILESAASGMGCYRRDITWLGFFGEIWLYNDTTFVLKCTGGASLFDFVAFFNSFASWWFASNIKNWPRTLTTVCPAVLSYWSLLTIVLQFDSHTCLPSGSAKRYHCAMLFKQK